MDVLGGVCVVVGGVLSSLVVSMRVVVVVVACRVVLVWVTVGVVDVGMSDSSRDGRGMMVFLVRCSGRMRYWGLE